LSIPFTAAGQGVAGQGVAGQGVAGHGKAGHSEARHGKDFMSIPFLQYLRPHGERRSVHIDRSPDIEGMARLFIASGGRFECEELRTGDVSLTACKFGRDVAIEVVPNGPLVEAAVDRLVRKSQAFLASDPFPEEG